MFGERRPAEPSEPFPEYTDPFPEYTDPFPEYTNPFPEYPAPPSERPRRTDEDGDARKPAVVAAVESGYVGLLAVFRVGIAALALGALMLGLGGGGYYAELVAVIGLATCAYGCHRYLVYRRILQEAGPPREP